MLKSIKNRALVQNRLLSPNSSVIDDIFRFMTMETVPLLNESTYTIFESALKSNNIDRALDILFEYFPDDKQDKLEQYISTKVALSLQK